MTSLSLMSTKVTDAGLASVGKLDGIEHLVLARNKLTDAGLKELRGMKLRTAIASALRHRRECRGGGRTAESRAVDHQRLAEESNGRARALFRPNR